MSTMNGQDAPTTHRHHKDISHPHVTVLINEPISKLTPFSGLIITIILVVFFLIRYYLFENFLMRKVYGNTFKNLSDVNKRGFVNHHLAGGAKIVMFIVGAYPFIDVAFGHATVHTPYGSSKLVTLGDVLIVLTQVFISMYVFELLYRAKLSPIAVMHHVGAVMIAQSAVAMGLNWQHEQDATIEFILCWVWGVFDVLAEFWPHVAIILYRCYPNEHDFLRKVFLCSGISTFLGTLFETIVVMWLFGSLWSRWTLPFKVVTPILHVVFSSAQLWGAYNFYCMWKRQKQLADAELKEPMQP